MDKNEVFFVMGFKEDTEHTITKDPIFLMEEDDK